MCNHGYILDDGESGSHGQWLVLAEGISRLGDAVTMVAFPLVAVLVLDASAAELALIGAAQAVPILLMSLPAGAWVDTRPRRWPLLVSADVARALLLAVVPLAALAGGCPFRCSSRWPSSGRVGNPLRRCLRRLGAAAGER